MRLFGGIPAHVRFDKAATLDSIMDETDIALMFFSTVYLNCMARGIPVVSLGWNPFFWREQFEREGLVQFARSIEEAYEMIQGREQLVLTAGLRPPIMESNYGRIKDERARKQGS